MHHQSGENLRGLDALNNLLKGFHSKRKEFAPLESKFFPFRVEPFSEGRQNALTELPSLKMYQIPLIAHCIHTRIHYSNIGHLSNFFFFFFFCFWRSTVFHTKNCL